MYSTKVDGRYMKGSHLEIKSKDKASDTRVYRLTVYLIESPLS